MLHINWLVAEDTQFILSTELNRLAHHVAVFPISHDTNVESEDAISFRGVWLRRLNSQNGVRVCHEPDRCSADVMKIESK